MGRFIKTLPLPEWSLKPAHRLRAAHTLEHSWEEDHRYVFTLIHKFRTEGDEKHPVLSERSDIIVIADEANTTPLPSICGRLYPTPLSWPLQGLP